MRIRHGLRTVAGWLLGVAAGFLIMRLLGSSVVVSLGIPIFSAIVVATLMAYANRD